MDVTYQLETLTAAIKRLLIDGNYFSDSGGFLRILSREDIEEARGTGSLTMEFENNGDLICRLIDYNAGG